MLLVWFFHNKPCVVDYVLCGTVCVFFYRLFLIAAILFFVMVHFLIIAFNLVIFVPVVLLFILPDYLLTVFLDISRFVLVMTFWYIHTFCISEIFPLVPVSPASHARILILGFYVERFFISSWIYLSWLFVHSVKFHQNWSWILSIVIRSTL